MKLYICVILVVLKAIAPPHYVRAGDRAALTDNACRTTESDLMPSGTWADFDMPATLDLTERADLAINALTLGPDSKAGYKVRSRFSFGRQAPTTACEMQVFPVGIAPCLQLRVLPLMRLMTGSARNLDLERAMMQAQLEWITSTGLLRYPPGDSIIPSDHGYPSAAGYMVLALHNWQARDPHGRWEEAAAQLTKGLIYSAVRRGPKAYYPPESGTDSKGNWHSDPSWDDKLLSKPYVDYDPTAEPKVEHLGYKGSTLYEQAGPLLALIAASKDQETTAVQGAVDSLAEFMLQPRMWEAPDSDPGSLGKWSGNVAGHLAALEALLKFAERRGRTELLQRIARGYERALELGLPQIGWFPYWAPTGAHGFPTILSCYGDPCATALAIRLGIELSEAGIRDCWDEIDRFVRNQLIEYQFTSVEGMRACVHAGRPVEAESPKAGLDLFAQFLGGFGGGEPATAGLIHMDKNCVVDACCTANAALAIYLAWQSITRFDGRTATVNLLLNRTAPWLTIQSWLPFEGRVSLTNHQAGEIRLRLPDYVNRTEVRVMHGGHRIPTKITDHWLSIHAVQPGDIVDVEFDVPHTTARFDFDERVHQLKFSGNTVVSIEPHPDDPYQMRLYQSEDRVSRPVPAIRKVRRFVAEEITAY